MRSTPPEKPRRRDLESPIQAAIVEAIRAGFPDALVFSIPNGGFIADPRTVAKLKWTGLLPGAPDLGLAWTGGHGFIEVKSANGRPSPEQTAIHAILRAKGHRVAICRSADDAIATLTDWGVVCRIQSLRAGDRT